MLKTEVEVTLKEGFVHLHLSFFLSIHLQNSEHFLHGHLLSMIQQITEQTEKVFLNSQHMAAILDLILNNSFLVFNFPIKFFTSCKKF